MLSIRGKKVLLSLHILLISIWLGSLSIILFLQLYKHTYFMASDFRIVDRLIFAINDMVIMNISVIVALSGLLFSLFSPWGFFKFRWIIFKWLAVLLIALFLLFWAAPAINGMAALSDVHGNQVAMQAKYLLFEQQVLQQTLFQLIALITVITVSVFKPWGMRQQKFRLKRKTVLFAGSVSGLLLVIMMLMQYIQLQQYRALPIQTIDLAKLKDGLYYGKAEYGFDYEVEVRIKDRQIIQIEILKNRDSFYAQLAEGITKKIVHAQQPATDAVTGATTTSKILMKAVESALSSR